MEAAQLTWITNFIWGIADDVLRDRHVRGKYRDVILPMTVLDVREAAARLPDEPEEAELVDEAKELTEDMDQSEDDLEPVLEEAEA